MTLEYLFAGLPLVLVLLVWILCEIQDTLLHGDYWWRIESYRWFRRLRGGVWRRWFVRLPFHHEDADTPQYIRDMEAEIDGHVYVYTWIRYEADDVYYRRPTWAVGVPAVVEDYSSRQ